MTYIRVGFSNGRRGRMTDVRLLVDTGSIYSMLPRGFLGELGVRPEWMEVFEVANGDGMVREVGRAYVHYRKRALETLVVFGGTRDAKVLGMYALEGLGLALDPRSRRVSPLRKKLLVSVAPA